MDINVFAIKDSLEKVKELKIIERAIAQGIESDFIKKLLDKYGFELVDFCLFYIEHLQANCIELQNRKANQDVFECLIRRCQ